MFKEVKIGGKLFPMVANAATAIRYKQVFGRDLLKEMSNEDEMSVAGLIQELGYIMAMAGAGEDMNKLNQETYITWLEGFDALDFFDETAATDIMNLWQGNKAVSAEAKKKPEQPSEA